MRRVRVALAGVFLTAFVALAATSPGAAQTHEHGDGSGYFIAHDAPAGDGRTFVGNLNHFAVIAHGPDEVPDFHQNMHIRVTLNGAVLWETTPDSGHDYDGINAFDVVFPVAGNYEVAVLNEAGEMQAGFTGVVEPAPLGAMVDLRDDIEAGGPAGFVAAGQPVIFTYHLEGMAVQRGEVQPDADILAHTDVWFEVFLNGLLEFRTKTHTHDEEQQAAYTFAGPGSYVVRLTGFQAYASMNATRFAPVVVERTIEVLPAPPVTGANGLERLEPPGTDLNAVVRSVPEDGFELIGSYDPYTIVGQGTLQHLYASVVDPATGETIQHVDFEATLTAVGRTIFSSDTLHEYDGILEVTTRQAWPGLYNLQVTASRGTWSATINMPYRVAPFGIPNAAGLVDFTVTESASPAGTASDVEVRASASSGPAAHSEFEMRLMAPGLAVPIINAKLHTHDDGLFPFKVGLQAAGDHEMILTPFTLMGEPVVMPPSAVRLVLTSQLGPGFPPPAIQGEAEIPGDDRGVYAPGAPLLAWIGSAACAAWVGRRRGGPRNG